VIAAPAAFTSRLPRGNALYSRDHGQTHLHVHEKQRENSAIGATLASPRKAKLKYTKTPRERKLRPGELRSRGADEEHEKDNDHAGSPSANKQKDDCDHAGSPAAHQVRRAEILAKITENDQKTSSLPYQPLQITRENARQNQNFPKRLKYGVP